VSWDIVYAKHAQKDAQKLAASGMKNEAQELLAIIKENPFQNPPPYEKLTKPWGQVLESSHMVEHGAQRDSPVRHQCWVSRCSIQPLREESTESHQSNGLLRRPA